MKNYLENRKVIVKPIPERFNPDYTRLDPKHIGRFQFEHCSSNFYLPLSAKHRCVFPILDEDQQAFFEKKLYMSPGELSFYRKGKDKNDKDSYNFWYDFGVSLKGEQELILNLAEPLDYLRWLILKAFVEDFAPSWEQRLDRPSYKWALVNEDYEEKINNKTSDLKGKAYIELSSIRSNKKKMMDILRGLGKMYSDTTDESKLISELTNIIETPETDTKNLNIRNFIDIMNDGNLATRALVNEAIHHSIIRKEKKKYWFAGTELGGSVESIVEYLVDPANSEERTIIATKIKENK